jgi:predicted permease
MPLRRRLSNLFSRSQNDREIDAELRAHIELRIADNLSAGMSPEDARRDALLRFGNPTATRERVAQADAALTLASIWSDVRYGFRQLRRSPGFTAVALITLALGIGANTAIFSLIDAALLKMLPVRDPQQLVDFNAVNPVLGVNEQFSYRSFQAFEQQTRVLEGVLAFRKLYNMDLEVDGQSGLADGQLVSGSYFSVLGVKAILGRTILPADESVAGQSPVAVIGYDYWRSRFALDPDVIGQKILLNNAPFTIVGVTAPEFFGLQAGQRIDVSVPLTTVTLVRRDFADPDTPVDVLKAPFRNWLNVMGRLQPGVTSQQAMAALAPVFAQSMRETAASFAGLPFDSPAARQSTLQSKLRLDPGSQGLASLRRQFSKPLFVVMAIVALLLLVACANVANLQLARAGAREKEIAVRMAVGAARMRVVRQLLTESILLAVLGGALGMAAAYGGTSALMTLLGHARTPILLTVRPDGAVLGFTLTVSVLTALLSGMIPAVRAARLEMTPALQCARGAGIAGVRSRLAKSLVVLQVAVSLVLLIGAGLLARSLANLKSFYPGFNKNNVLLFTVNPMMIGQGFDQLAPLYEGLLDRIRATPGVRAASLSFHSPLSSGGSTTAVRVVGFRQRPDQELAQVKIEVVGPGYFATMQTPILRGRDFTSADRKGAVNVAIVNESLARYYFGDANPIGRLVSVPGYRGDDSSLQIVAEVKDVKYHDLREGASPGLYLAALQYPESGATFEIRTAVDPDELETTVLQAVKEVDSRLPVFDVKTLGEQFDESLTEERLVATLSGMFGALALLLACVGLYGLMAYTVSRRATEIGIRMALGAERGRIARMVLRETLLLVGCGLALGIPASALAMRWIASQLFGLKPDDLLTFVEACVVMTLVASIASFVPARRAASVDPMQALRSE